MLLYHVFILKDIKPYVAAECKPILLLSHVQVTQACQIYMKFLQIYDMHLGYRKKIFWLVIYCSALSWLFYKKSLATDRNMCQNTGKHRSTLY